MNNGPMGHLLHRYGMRGRGMTPAPDCRLCEAFVADLPVKSVADWMEARGRRADDLMRQVLAPAEKARTWFGLR